MQNFRSFQNTGLVDIRPITIIVGENSSGKTSFLAGIRSLLSSFNNKPDTIFNAEPFFLGGFDQIAHYRGGKGGRAHEFSLRIVIPLTTKGATRDSRSISHRMTFVKGMPQPRLRSYEMECEDYRFSINLEEGAGHVVAGRRNRRLFKSDDTRLSDYIRNIGLMFVPVLVSEFLKDKESAVRDFPEQIIEGWGDSIRRLSNRNPFASAPVRTQPLRTYTPSEITASAEGAHVPLTLARMKTSDPKRWEQVQKQLGDFGKKAGLFDNLDVRLLGRKDGNDPFQVTVRRDGPSANLVDVGYGVSQSIPLAYQFIVDESHQDFLIQQPEVHLHPRAQAEIASLIIDSSNRNQKKNYLIETHSDYIVDRMRIEVMNKRLHHDRILILFFSKPSLSSYVHPIYIDANGNLLKAPSTYREFFLREHAKLLGIGE